MVERKDCKYFQYVSKRIYGIDKPTAQIIRMPICKIDRMSAGGCKENCQWFEQKI
jgi:hypothetical protein